MTSPWLRREFVEALSSGVNGRRDVAFPNPCVAWSGVLAQDGTTIREEGDKAMLRRLQGFALTIATVVTIAVAPGPAAAAYPEKPIKIIVMYSPGGSSDVVTRILARYLEPILGQPVVVQNVAGGGGAVGWQQALQARPDGYTLTLFLDSLPVMEATGAVDFTQDEFEPVAVWGTMPLTIFAKVDGPYQSLGDYMAAAKERPGEVGLAMGYGTPSQFVGKIVADAMGADLNLVNVGGGAQKKAAVLGGHVDAGIEPTPGMAEPYRAGQFDLLAILSDERLEAFPDVPTAKEQGVDAVHANTYAVVALKGTPEDRLEVLDQAIAQVVQDPEFLAENQKINFDITYMNRAESKAHMEKVRERMLSIGQSLGF
jgi:tripartite-type tricarboxylate transporter receptor subunit TctC